MLHKQLATFLYEVQKSKFIGLIYEVKTIEEVMKIYKELKVEHKKAKHICYGYYILDENVPKIKGSDAGEPRGVATQPIISCLEKNNLKSNVIFVIRYFGGIKLGIGGLSRAYTKTVYELIKEFNNLK